MTRRKGAAGALLALFLVGSTFPVAANAQGAVLERSRRTSSSFDRSYEAGFDAGYRVGYGRGGEDSRDNRRRNASDVSDYRKADSVYNKSIPNRDQFRLGYEAGFTKGYDDAFTGRQYGARPGESPVAVNGGYGGNGRPGLRRGGRRNKGYGQNPSLPGSNNGGYNGPVYGPTNGGYGGQRRASYDTTMTIELETPITTRYSNVGDRFSARVVEPRAYYGARVEGYLSKVDKPGRVSGKGEIVLQFERIVWPDGYAEPVQAQVEEVIGYPNGQPTAGGGGPFKRAPWDLGKKRDRNDDVDAEAGDEGQIEGDSSRGRDAATIGGGAAAGAVLGGILGGGSGAVLGAVLGGAAGGGVVAGTKGHDIDLEPGMQLRIRTGQPARVD